MSTFKRCVPLGLLPRIISYHFLDYETQGWEENIERIYFDVRQLFWNSLYVQNRDEKKVLRYRLEKLGLSLLRQQRLLLRYEKYAITHNFEIKIASIQSFAILFYEYSQALGVML